MSAPDGSIDDTEGEYHGTANHRAEWQSQHQDRASRYSDDLERPRESAPLSGLCVRGRIGDQVVEEDSEGGKTDRASEVGDQDQNGH
jgi:hypothetical protein